MMEVETEAEELTEDEKEMMNVMGFSNFSSSKVRDFSTAIMAVLRNIHFCLAVRL